MITIGARQRDMLEYLQGLAPAGKWFVLDRGKGAKALGLPANKNAFNNLLNKLVYKGVVERSPEGGHRVKHALNGGKIKVEGSITPQNMIVEYEGRSVVLADLCKEKGISADRVFHRIKKYAWNLERALTTPDRVQEKPKFGKRLIRYAGWEPKAGQWA
jgi:hypothetical protein